jgi:arabinose-5-phosphate isomerase
VLRHEADAIAALADRLDASRFAAAARLLTECAGNVATIGIGTSGILARKLAATLTSTGTAAVFVHPADALHGGLGFIGRQGVVIAISNSGETEELLSLLPYLRQRDVPVIAIVGKLDSVLAREAAVALEAPVEREADPLDLVPTASAMVALAVGDALALTVMHAKGVTPEGFAANHPSGRLGRRLTLRVRDVMRAASEEATIAEDASLLETVTAISDGGVGAVAVVGPGAELVGIVTDGDIRRTVQHCEPATLGDVTARDVMTRDPVTTSPETMAYDALRQMEDRPSQIAVLPVVDGGHCLGLLRLHDLVRIGL